MKKRKQLTFDIDTNVAKEILGEKSYTTAYANIKSFMKSEGWLHIEGSVYMSSKPLSTTKVAHLINKLKKQYPYLTKCIRNMHQSDISNVHSLEHHFDYDGTPGKFKQQENQKTEEQKTKPIKATSLKDRIAQKKAIIEQRDSQRNSPHKDKSHSQEL